MEGSQKKWFDKALEGIRRFTDAELIEIITHGASCYGRGCSDCKANNEVNNNECFKGCQEILGAAGLELHRRLTESHETPAPKESPQSTGDMLPFEKTINFMRERGYKRCYMCGSSLEGGSNNNVKQ